MVVGSARLLTRPGCRGGGCRSPALRGGGSGPGPESGNGRGADIVGAGDLPHPLATGAALKGLALLVRGELRAASQLHAARLGAGAALAGAGFDQVALELGQAAQDNGEQFVVWGG